MTTNDQHLKMLIERADHLEMHGEWRAALRALLSAKEMIFELLTSKSEPYTLSKIEPSSGAYDTKIDFEFTLSDGTRSNAEGYYAQHSRRGSDPQDYRMYSEPQHYTVLKIDNEIVIFITGDQCEEAWIHECNSLNIQKLAYCYAHIARANIEETIHIHSLHQILPSGPKDQIVGHMQHFDLATWLRSDYEWAYAHWGDSYRKIGNAWFEAESSTTLIQCGDKRKWYYEEAIKMFKKSYPQDAKARTRKHAWAQAHHGATIVNSRAFIMQPNDDFKKENIEEISTAKDLLKQAVQGSTGLYPWAEVYYSGALLIEGSIKGDGDDFVREELVASFLYMIDGYYQDSSMLSGGFEPGAPYVNCFLQQGLLWLWRGQYDLAWRVTRAGMTRTYNFHFVPGLGELLGFQILIATLVKSVIQGAAVGPKTKASIIPEGPIAVDNKADPFIMSESPIFGIDVPLHLPSSKDKRIELALKIMCGAIQFTKSSMTPFLQREARTAPIQMSLISAMTTFASFKNTCDAIYKFGQDNGGLSVESHLPYLEADDRADEAYKAYKAFYEAVWEQVPVSTQPASPNTDPLQLIDERIFGSACAVLSGRMSYSSMMMFKDVKTEKEGP